MVFSVFCKFRSIPKIVLACAIVFTGYVTNAAEAQEKPSTLLELLIGRDKPSPKVQEIPRKKSTGKRVIRSNRSSSSSSASRPRPVRAPAETASPASEPVSTEKVENAHVVLVVGDFIADGMAQGLEEAFAEVQSVVILSRANGSSGFVRDDFYDWPNAIGPIMEEVKPSVVVMMIGSNDRQAMRVDGRTEKVRTEAWDKEYISRINRFAKAVRATNTPLVWVGGPPFRFKSMSADILAFNEFYRTAVEAVEGNFVDIWDGFVDQDGAFVTTGSNINGQNVRLRASDGINFTKEGKRKLAFYVERQLRQMLGDAASPLLTTLAPESLSTMRLPPLQAETELVRFNPIPIDDPEMDGGAVLLGDINDASAVNGNSLQSKPLRNRLVEDGLPAPAQAGRSNDFSWPPTGS
jgi:uncharacterized protein